MSYSVDFAKDFLNNQLAAFYLIIGASFFVLLGARLAHRRLKVELEGMRWKWLFGGMALILCSFAVVNTLLQSFGTETYELLVPEQATNGYFWHDIFLFGYTGFFATVLLILSGLFYILSSLFPVFVKIARSLGLAGVFWPLIQVFRVAWIQDAPSLYYVAFIEYFLGTLATIYALIFLLFLLRRSIILYLKKPNFKAARTQLYYASSGLICALLIWLLALLKPDSFAIYIPLFLWAALSFASSIFEWLRPISMMNAARIERRDSLQS